MLARSIAHTWPPMNAPGPAANRLKVMKYAEGHTAIFG
jgi:hypothetical protein